MTTIQSRSILGVTTLWATLAATALFAGCGDDACVAGEACICDGEDCEENCDGAGCSYECLDGASCDFHCPEGGCSVKCTNAASCTLDCGGGSCSMECSGTDACTLNECGLNCPLSCGGAATCTNGCGIEAGCPTTP
jgi:hypothetical protein